MGKKASALFVEAGQLGGVVGMMRLAAMATVTSTEAAAAADTPELLERLETALAKLRRTSVGDRVPTVPDPVTGDAELLRGHIQAYIELMSQRAIFNDLPATTARVTEMAAVTLKVERVSVWRLQERGSYQTIECLDLFLRGSGTHSAGTVLSSEACPAYFTALARGRTIAAYDALTDARTAEFASDYLVPLGIGAMLDVPIWAEGRAFGVICHEHVGKARTWTGDEERFAYLMAHFVGLAVERRPR